MRLVILASLAALCATPTLAGSAAGSASATVVQPVTVVQAQALAFGAFSQAASSYTVTMTPQGQITAGAAQISGTHAPGVFNITGQPLAVLSVSVDGAFLLNGPGGAAIGVSTTNDAGAGITLNASGAATVNVGGTANVPSNAPVGAYTGSFTVTANYQ